MEAKNFIYSPILYLRVQLKGNGSFVEMAHTGIYNEIAY